MPALTGGLCGDTCGLSPPRSGRPHTSRVDRTHYPLPASQVTVKKDEDGSTAAWKIVAANPIVLLVCIAPNH